MLSIMSYPHKNLSNSSSDVNNNAIELQPVFRPASPRISESSAEVCPITYQAIRDINPQDVHKTLCGVSYYRPALKLWLRKSDMLPHNGAAGSGKVERDRLFSAEIAEQKRHNTLAKVAKYGTKVLASASALSLPTGVGLMVKSTQLKISAYDADNIQVDADLHCATPDVLASPAGFGRCVDAFTEAAFAQNTQEIKHYKALSFVFLGIGVGLMLSAIALTTLKRYSKVGNLDINQPVRQEEVEAMSASLDLSIANRYRKTLDSEAGTSQLP